VYVIEPVSRSFTDIWFVFGEAWLLGMATRDP